MQKLFALGLNYIFYIKKNNEKIILSYLFINPWVFFKTMTRRIKIRIMFIRYKKYKKDKGKYSGKQIKCC